MKDWFKARNIWGAAVMTLSDAEAGRLAKALWTYTMSGEQLNLSGAEKGIFAMILMTLGQDEQADADISKKRAVAGSTGGKQTQANRSKQKQTESNGSNCFNKNKEKERDNKVSNETYAREQMFDRFWASYPRHTNKQAAQKAFERLKPDDDLLNIMLQSLSAWSKSDQWTRDGGQYIPHPATWLNGRRWEDELPKAAGPQMKAVSAQQYNQRQYTEDELLAVSDDILAEARKQRDTA